MLGASQKFETRKLQYSEAGQSWDVQRSVAALLEWRHETVRLSRLANAVSSGAVVTLCLSRRIFLLRTHHFPPRVLTSIALERLLLRSDPMLCQALRLLYPQTLSVVT